MWFKIEDNAITEQYKNPTSLLLNGLRYPQNIFNLWSEAELEAIGIYSLDSIDNTNTKNSRYYTNTGITYVFSDGKVTGSYGVAGAKALDDSTDLEGNLVKGLKTQLKEETDDQQYGLLLHSDWMAVRKSDTGEAIHTAWKTYRDDIRTESDRHKTAIASVSTVDALAALTVNWPSKPD